MYLSLGLTLENNNNSILGGGSSPVNTVAPVISGTAVVGQVLTGTTGTWTGTPTITFSYQWKRGATNIGTNTNTYTLVQADAGDASNITLVVTGTNGSGMSSATSNTIVQVLDLIASNFLVAAGILDPTITTFANFIALSAKGQDTSFNPTAINFYTTYNLASHFYHPYVGGTATTCKYNFWNPATFVLQFLGGWTFASTGGTPNGTTGYAKTGYIPSVNANLNSARIAFYSGMAGTGDSVDMGVSNSLSTNYTLDIEISYTGSYFAANNTIAYQSVANIIKIGYFQNNRTSSILCEQRRDAVVLITGTSVVVGLPTREIYEGARNDEGTPHFFSNKEIRGVDASTGMSSSDMTVWRNIIQQGNTILSRQV